MVKFMGKLPYDKSSKLKDFKVASSFTSGASQNVPTSRKRVCISCKGDHRLLFCSVFKDMKLPERLNLVSEHKLCDNCLIPYYTADNCRRPAVCSIPGCGLKHTKFIHVNLTSRDQVGSVQCSFSRANGGVSVNSSSHANWALADVSVDVCVPIVSVKVNQKIEVSALLDTGSTTSFCSRRLVDFLGVKGTRRKYSLSTLSRHEEHKTTEVDSLKLESLDGSEFLEMSNVYVIDQIPINVPNVDVECYSHLRNLVFPDSCSQVDLLIGQDNAVVLVPLETRSGDKSEPFAVRTLFGWCINGPTRSGTVHKSAISHFVTTSLDESVERFWQIEEDGVTRDELAWSIEDKQTIALWDYKT